MWVIIWILTLFCFQHTISGYIEIVNVTGCENCKLHLTCRHLNSIIAILAADFHQLPSDETVANNSLIITPTVFPPFHPRQALNQRCSGINHCSFILTEDCPGADKWGAGILTVKYACISEDRIKTYCNSEIILPSNQNSGISEGFIHNPGYPRFYSSERECRWKLRAPYQQRIRLTVLDLAVIGEARRHFTFPNLEDEDFLLRFFPFPNRALFPNDCTDHLEIIDDGQVIETTCNPQEPPLEILSRTDNMEIVLASSHSLVPRRGVLLYYTAVGCSTPEAPEDGYLVYRNDTIAEYRCCVGFIFPDDGARTRIIECEGAYWNVPLPLPNCKRKLAKSTIQESTTTLKEEDMNNDILAPALLIVALFLINFIVLFYIYKIKQKHAIEFADEELGTLSVQNEPLSP